MILLNRESVNSWPQTLNPTSAASAFYRAYRGKAFFTADPIFQTLQVSSLPAACAFSKPFKRHSLPSFAIKMPMELPGFYFDIEKNRYFPLSSRPTPKRRDLESGSKEITQTSQVPEPSGMKRRKLPLYSASVALPTTTCYHRRVSMQQ